MWGHPSQSSPVFVSPSPCQSFVFHCHALLNRHSFLSIVFLKLTPPKNKQTPTLQPIPKKHLHLTHLWEVAHNVTSWVVVFCHDVEEEGFHIKVQCLVVQKQFGQQTEVLTVHLWHKGLHNIMLNLTEIGTIHPTTKKRKKLRKKWLDHTLFFLPSTSKTDMLFFLYISSPGGCLHTHLACTHFGLQVLENSKLLLDACVKQITCAHFRLRILKTLIKTCVKEILHIYAGKRCSETESEFIAHVEYMPKTNKEARKHYAVHELTTT